jgi:hypothetical protein
VRCAILERHDGTIYVELTLQIQHPAAIMRLLFYPAQKEKPITEENPGIGVS